MALASATRQPFAELGASRLQRLSSEKNCQNANTERLLKEGKEKHCAFEPKIELSSPSKRPFSLSIFEDEAENAENIDPVASPTTKRSKNFDGQPTIKAGKLFGLTVEPNLGSVETKPATPNSYALLPAPSSAPVGRLPKPKRVGLLSKKRSSFSPFKRVEPPAFGSNKNKSAAVPFSIDEAISGTISKAKPAAKQGHVPGQQKSAPKSWFFDIHEDTPDEEAAIMMEHSTGILDISSDDEAGPSRIKDERGKENIPPPDSPVQSAVSNVDTVASKPRRSVHVDAMVDEGEDRAPLGALPTEDFYAEGFDKNSVEVIIENHELDAAEGTLDEENTAVEVTNGPDKENTFEKFLNDEVFPRPSNPTTIDSCLGSAKPDFVIAEDPVDSEPR